MANYIKTDKGDMHIAIGASGSKARLAVERPKLIEELRKIHGYEVGTKVADDLILNVGITSPMERRNLLEISGFQLD